MSFKIFVTIKYKLSQKITRIETTVKSHLHLSLKFLFILTIRYFYTISNFLFLFNRMNCHPQWL